MQTFIYIPQHLYLSHESPLDFCSSRVLKRVGCRLLRVGCFTCTYHLEKFVESCIHFLWFHFPSQEKKQKKKKTMNINSKRKKNPGKEIKHLLFFIVGKVAILSTFFDWRKSMYSEVWTLKKLYSKFWSWLAGIFHRSNSGNIREKYTK